MVLRCALQNWLPMSESGQTRTSSLGAARPLPPSKDIGPGGQSVGQAAQFCLAREPGDQDAECQGQHAQGDRHLNASRTRFIPKKLLGLFERTTWPVVSADTAARIGD